MSASSKPTRDAAGQSGTAYESSPKIVFKQLYARVERGTRLRKFMRARRRVQAGEPLFDYCADQIEKEGVLGPLSFNLYQSTMSVAPGMLIVKAYQWIVPNDTADTAPSPTDDLERAISQLAPRAQQPADSITLPLTLFLLSVVAGWASFHSGDGSKEQGARARRAYLYFDGAYGRVP
jgi:hypothetical protein